jgi:HK97 gp10 family phage protein
MASLSQKFDGYEEWARQLYTLTPSYQAQIEDLYSRGADYMVDTAQSLCPVEVDAPFRRAPGTLRDSIHKEISRDGDRTVTMVIEGSVEAFYATFVEFGTRSGVKGQRATVNGRDRRVYRTHSGTAARPHFFPAYHLASKWIYERLAHIELDVEPESRASIAWHVVTAPLHVGQFLAAL